MDELLDGKVGRPHCAGGEAGVCVVCACVHACVHACVCACVHAACVCERVYVCVCGVCACVCMCMHVCVRVYNRFQLTWNSLEKLNNRHLLRSHTTRGHSGTYYVTSRQIASLPGCETLEGGYEYDSDSAKKICDTIKP